MKDLLLKIKKRNYIYKFFSYLSVFILFAVPMSSMFGYFRGNNLVALIWLISCFSLIYFMKNTYKKLSLSELEIIKNDDEYKEFKKVLKDFVKDETHLNYMVIEKAFTKFEKNKIFENAARKNFVDSLKE